MCIYSKTVVTHRSFLLKSLTRQKNNGQSELSFFLGKSW